MLARFSLALLFAVLVAASRPVPHGGEHDLLAVGVRIEETRNGQRAERLVLAPPTEEALVAYDALLQSPARDALLQGTGIHASFDLPLHEQVPPSGPAAQPVRERRVEALVFYGTRSRAGRSEIEFDGAGSGAVDCSAARAAARSMATLLNPDTVTAAAARVLLQSPDDAAFGDALETLAAVRADLASAEALAVALAPEGDASATTVRRVQAVRVLKRLGGAAMHPDAFRALAASRDPLVHDAAK